MKEQRKKYIFFSTFPLILILVSGTSKAGKQRIILKHPDLLDQFKVSKHANVEHLNYNVVSPEDMKKNEYLCKESLNGNTFQLIKKKDSTLPSRIFPFMNVNDVTVFYSNQGYKLPLVSLKLKGLSHSITVVKCAKVLGRTHYIEYGADENRYFAFWIDKGILWSKHYIVLVECHATVVWNVKEYTRNFRSEDIITEIEKRDLKKCEIEFRSSEFEDKKFGQKRICSLNQFQRYELCCTAFMAWNSDNFTNMPHIYKISPESTNTYCIENANIKLQTLPNLEFGRGTPYYPVDLLSCQVHNRKQRTIQFFVTPHQQLSDIAFIFEKFNLYYSIVMKIRNVSVLQNNL